MAAHARLMNEIIPDFARALDGLSPAQLAATADPMVLIGLGPRLCLQAAASSHHSDARAFEDLVRSFAPPISSSGLPPTSPAHAQLQRSVSERAGTSQATPLPASTRLDRAVSSVSASHGVVNRAPAVPGSGPAISAAADATPAAAPTLHRPTTSLSSQSPWQFSRSSQSASVSRTSYVGQQAAASSSSETVVSHPSLISSFMHQAGINVR